MYYLTSLVLSGVLSGVSRCQKWLRKGRARPSIIVIVGFLVLFLYSLFSKRLVNAELVPIANISFLIISLIYFPFMLIALNEIRKTFESWGEGMGRK